MSRFLILGGGREGKDQGKGESGFRHAIITGKDYRVSSRLGHGSGRLRALLRATMSSVAIFWQFPKPDHQHKTQHNPHCRDTWPLILASTQDFGPLQTSLKMVQTALALKKS